MTTRLSAAAALFVSAVALAQDNTPPTLVGSFSVVNNGPGNQTNPHVACDLASYTNDDFQGASTIHYWNFTTSTDHMVPGNQVDLLSDVSGNRIAFTEVTLDGDTVALFD